MKNKLLVLFTIVIFWSFPVKGQNILTLSECYDMAAKSNPISGEKDDYINIAKLKTSNLSKGWLPTLDANGSFLYNSSVVDMSDVIGALPVPGIADAIQPLPHEQYKLTVDINQTIYDGGIIKRSKAFEEAGLKVNEKQTDVDLYKLRDQVNSYYFRLLILAQQKRLLNNYLDLITKKIAAMQSGVNNGVIRKSDTDVLKSEKIKIEQQLYENDIMKNSFLTVLSDLTGKDIDESTELILPEPPESVPGDLNRPEIELLELKKDQLSATTKMLESKRMPKAFGFASLGYGNPPGSNFFKDEFDSYYVVGAGIKWNIFDWDKVKNEKQIISFQQNVIDKRKNDLSDNLNRMLKIKEGEIISLKTLMERDEELISLRKSITKAAESKYDNGTITATEYLNEMNAEHEVMINHEIHKINLALAQIEYCNISGKEIE